MSEVNGNIMQRVINFFRDDDWKFNLDGNILITSIECTNCTCRIFVFVNEENSTIQVLSTIDTKISYSKRPAVAEFLTRANFGLNIGNFEFDLNDGQIRYKTSMDVEGSEDLITNKIMHNLVYTSFGMMDRYFSGFMRINYSSDDQIDIKAIIQDIEG